MQAGDAPRPRVAATVLLAGTLAACGADQASLFGADPTVAEGRRLYERYCLACHQYDGSGVPGMQPPLRDSAIVAGDVARIVEVVLRGSDAFAASGYQNAMPAFASLADGDIAALLTYVRAEFADGTARVGTTEVASARAHGGVAGAAGCR